MGETELPIKNDDNSGPDIQSVIFLENPVVERYEVTHTVLTTEFLNQVCENKNWYILERIDGGKRFLDIYKKE